MIFGCEGCWDKIYRKSFIDKYNIRFSNDYYHEDIVFLWYWKIRTKWVYFYDKKLTNYVKRTYSSVNSLTDKMINADIALPLKLYKLIYDDLVKNKKWEEYKTPYLQRMIKLFLWVENRFLTDKWHAKRDYINDCASFFSNFSIDDIPDKNDKVHFRSIVNRNYYAYGTYNTFETERPQPAFGNNNVNIAFGADKNTIPYLSVALQSLIDNSSANNNYDIVILYQEITDWQKRFLLSQIRGKDNFAIRFFNMANYAKKFYVASLLAETNLNIADYFKLFTEDIFRNYDKVLYLDWDLIVNRDIGKLYRTDMNGCAVAACPDIYVSLTNDDNLTEHMNDKKHFDTGVLLIDIHKFNESKLDHLIELAKKNTEHDVLNTIFANHYTPLPQEWNIQVHVKYYRGYRQMLPNEILAMYDEYEILPAAVRYTEQPKIWENPCIQWGDLWWRYAAKTPFYPEILKKLTRLETDKAIAKVEKSLSLQNTAIVNKVDYTDMSLLVHYRKNRLKYLCYSVMSRIFFFWAKQRKRKEHYKEKVKKARRIMAMAKL